MLSDLTVRQVKAADNKITRRKQRGIRTVLADSLSITYDTGNHVHQSQK